MIHQLRSCRHASPARRRPRPGVGRDRLDQHAALAELQVVDAARRVARVVDAAPERRVVERLAARALRVGVARLRLGNGGRPCRRGARRRDARRERSGWPSSLAAAPASAARGSAARSASEERGQRRCRSRQSHACSLGSLARSRSRSDACARSTSCAFQLAWSPGVQPGARKPLVLALPDRRVGLALAARGNRLHPLAAGRRERSRPFADAAAARRALMTSSPVRARRRACPASACRTRCPSPRPRCPCRG